MSTWSLKKLLHALAEDIGTQLARSRELIGHSVAKGDASEGLWLQLLQNYLPRRYEVRRAHVVDSHGQFSDQIDIVVHDRHYSPFVFTYGGCDVIPAESVYAVFEVKQSLDAASITYAHEKIASVRRLHRTSLPIPSAGGMQPAKTLHHIIGGALALESSWAPPFGKPLRTLLNGATNDQQLDFICVAGAATLERAADGTLTTDIADGAGARFLLALIARLQEIATVPMIDVRAYAAWLK